MTSLPKLALYGGAGSSAYRVRIALKYKRIPYDSIAVDIMGGEQHKPEYNAINPMRQAGAAVMQAVCGTRRHFAHFG